MPRRSTSEALLDLFDAGGFSVEDLFYVASYLPREDVVFLVESLLAYLRAVNEADDIDELPDDLLASGTLRNGRIEAKMIRAKGRLYGPYNYLRYKSSEGGRRVHRSLYLGKGGD